MMNTETIDQKLEIILPLVQKPGRYLGREVGAIYKDLADVELHICLTYPDVYELGMSNTGINVLYNLVNGTDGCYMERSYCPWLDMREQMIKHDVPLYSMETHTPLKYFDALGFSLQTELCFSNVPYMLELAKIPVFAVDRTEEDPLLLAGGPNMANPEPMADFFDFFVIGDGEAVLPAVLQILKSVKKQGFKRAERLKALSAIPGIYVPSLHETMMTEGGDLITTTALPENKKQRIKRTWVENVDNTYYMGAQVVPNIQPIHSRVGVEVMRGCTQGCRFCQAGYWDRPAREMEPSQVMAAVEHGVKTTGLDEVGLMSLSTADYSRVTDMIYLTKKQFPKDRHVGVSLPSLRADKFTAGLALEMDDVHGQSLTFAPETGSERLRQFINKNITNQQMFEAAEMAYKNGWKNVKLYFMIGIPSETWEDIESIVWLATEILKIGKRFKKRNSISANIGILSPKPFTALQWDGCGEESELQKKVQYLYQAFKKLGRFSVHGIDNYRLESSLSRADRRAANVIYEAYKNGACFDCWNETYDWDHWNKAFETCGIDHTHFQRKREFDEPLPWDVVDMGILKGVFKRERRNADKLAYVPDCKWGECSHCGIPGNYEDIKLAQEPRAVRDEDVIDEMRVLAKEEQKRMKEQQSETIVYNYRLHYTKDDTARFLSHRDCITFLEMAFRRSSLVFKYSEGFSPRMKLTVGPATPLGLASDIEYMDVQILERPPMDIVQTLNAFMPHGMSVVAFDPVTGKDFSIKKFEAIIRYDVTLAENYTPREGLAKWDACDSFIAGKKDRSKKQFESKEWVKRFVIPDEGDSILQIDMLYENGQPCLNVSDFVRDLYEMSDEDLLACKVHKRDMVSL